ncbi:hypothetical protein HY489_06155 [Candidatus Woesearchaeota archaeon]|nr:hypothetical protein [Candidatus Woesearchaeota archaeon]
MSFSRTLGFAIHAIFIGTLVTAPSFAITQPYLLLILSLVSGFSLISFFAHASVEERYEIMSFVFVLAAIIQIILGALTNLTAATPRNIPLELLVLFVGLFSPIFALGRITDQKLPLAPLLWNLASVAIVYLLVLGVVDITGAIT